MLQVGIEPSLHGAGVDAQVGGDVPVLAASVGEADDLEAVAEGKVFGPAEFLLQPLGLVLAQVYSDHLVV